MLLILAYNQTDITQGTLVRLAIAQLRVPQTTRLNAIFPGKHVVLCSANPSYIVSAIEQHAGVVGIAPIRERVFVSLIARHIRANDSRRPIRMFAELDPDNPKFVTHPTGGTPHRASLLRAFPRT